MVDRSKFTILWHSVASHIRSGYGTVTRNVTGRLVKAGFRVIVTCYYGIEPGGVLIINGVPHLPAKTGSFGELSVLHYAKSFKANLCTLLSDPWAFGWFPKKLPCTLVQGPWDHIQYPKEIQDIVRAYTYRVALSKFTVKEWATYDPPIDFEWIPHGVDTSVFRPMDKKKARETYGLSKDDFIIGIVGANSDKETRKFYGGMLRAVRSFLNNNPDVKDVKLFMYVNPKDSRGVDIEQLVNKYDLRSITVLQNPMLFDTGIKEEEMAILYNTFDVLLHTSMREGFGLCVAPWTKIATSKGLREIRDVKVGDKVYTHRGNLKRVTGVFRRSAPFLLKIKISNVPWSLYVTPEHPILAVKRRRRVELDDPEWVEAKDLSRGDLVALHLPVEKKQEIVYDLAKVDSSLEMDESHVWYSTGYSGGTGELVKYNRYIQLDEKLARLIGLYIARGSFNSNNPTHVEFHVRRSLGKEIARLARVIFGESASFDRERDRVFLCGKVIPKFLARLCGSSSDIHLPSEILTGESTLLKACLEAVLLDSNRRRVNIHTASQQLAHDLFIASLKLGWKPCCKLDSTGLYSLNITREAGRTHSNKIWTRENMAYLLVRSIRKVPYSSIVVNLEVEDDNSYNVWGASLHNCMYEAMSCGVPVIAHDFSAMTEAVREENGEMHGWLVKTAALIETPLAALTGIPDVDDIEDKIGKAYFNDSKRKKYGKKARQFMLQYDWDLVVKNKWIPYLDKIIEDRSEKPLSKRRIL
jgi:glycosyltransferase involved in cell wall biosynthesis